MTTPIEYLVSLTSPTQTAGDNSTHIATTAFVSTAVSTAVSPLASKASPAFTGTPTAPTATSGDSSTVLATTAFVADAVSKRLTVGTAIATTSGTSADFTGLPSWIKRITLSLNGWSSSGTSMPLVRLSTGAVFATAGYVGCVGNASPTQHSTGFIINNNYTANTLTLSGQIIITSMGSNLWSVSGVTAANAGTNNPCYLGGSIKLSGVLDGIRLSTVLGTDTFDAGSINILYE